MRKSLLFLLIAAYFFPMDFAWSGSQRALTRIEDLTHANKKVGIYRALIIGIDDYKDEDIPDLTTSVSDATALAQLLQKHYGFKLNLEKDLLLNRKATRAKIYRSLRDLAALSNPSDNVLIYYAGHGDLDQIYNDGWWIPVDARASDPLTYLDNGVVQKAMSSMQARHVLLISDSCYSGTLFGKSRSMPKVIDDKYYLGLYNEKSRWCITSGNKTPVEDSGTNGHSVFAYQLLKELRENQKPYLSTQEIYTDIAPIISNNSETAQVPLCNPILRTGDQGGQFIFIASGGAVIDAPKRTATSAQTSLSVKCNVPGAEVFIDDHYLDKMPFSKREVTPGHHKIRVIKEGYNYYEKEITVAQGWTKTFQVVLDKTKPLNGRLTVHTKPENADIRILNVAPKFYQGIELVAGKYHLEVSADGYEQYRIWIDLAAGEDKELDIDLNPMENASTGIVSASNTQSGQLNDLGKISSGTGSQKSVKNSLDMEFVYISPGTFIMGSPEDEEGRDGDEIEHKAKLTNGFYLQTTEVTQNQWKAVMGDNPSYFQNCGANCPVENVSWTRVQEFIQKLNQLDSMTNYRLPTEIEWEYAARAGSDSAFANGEIAKKGFLKRLVFVKKCFNDLSLDAIGWYCYNSDDSTHPVAQRKPNSWGLYDMHGNVWEWCQNLYGDYPTKNEANHNRSLVEDYRVLRGGSWYDSAKFCRSAKRDYKYQLDVYANNIGFRLAFF